MREQESSIRRESDEARELGTYEVIPAERGYDSCGEGLRHVAIVPCSWRSLESRGRLLCQ